jgi:hypothetical protein
MRGVLRNGGYGDFTNQFPRYGLQFEQSDGLLGHPEVDTYRLIRLLVWFEFIVDDPDEPGVEHTYSLDSGICETSSPNCTIASVLGEIRYHPTPGYMWNTKQVVDDEILDHVEVDAALPGDRAGPVRVKINPPGYPPNSIVNKTEPGHRFHPGEVIRTVYELNGEIRIHTFGSGTGANPGLNSAIGPIVYETVDQLISCHLVQGQSFWSACRPLHDRVPGP